MEDEWISRNPRKRDRRSYDSNWGVYEARGGNSFSNNGQASRSSYPSSGLSTGDIVVEGERVGMPHNGCAQQRSQQRSQQGGHQKQSNSYQQQQGKRQQQTAGYQQQSSGHQHQQQSRIRVADHRGSAARIGNLPAQNPSNNHNQISYGNQGGFNNSGPLSGRPSNNNPLPPGLAASLHAAITKPPPITVELPPELRSTLNKEQCSIVESVLSGNSVFFTGPAGSGKSHVLKSLLKANELGLGPNGTIGESKSIVLTATTGVAACSIGGTTIHSFAGITPNASAAECVKRIMGNEYAKKRWRDCDILVVDEISMMGAEFLDKLNFVAGRVRNDRRAFGGLQLVVCGDFFQLPPVDLAKDAFAFQAKCWPHIIKHCVLLKQVFRQQSDTTLMTILDEARVGELSNKSAQLLKRHETLPSAAFGSNNKSDTNIIPTLLECRNKNVDQANEREMAKLEGTVHTFQSKDRSINETYRNQLKNCQAPAKLDLKVGAQVLLLKNIDLEKGLANGSRGVVVRFQHPKSQAEVPVGFKNIDLPVVRFDSVKGTGELNGEDREFTILPEEWQNKMGDQTVSSRTQIPLRLAWSISVHKSQGMTIPNLTVNLSGVFEYGQAYVALSRATELKLLTLRGFSEKAFRAHPLVKEFYRMLENPVAAITATNDKENVEAHHGGELGELADPFGGSSNPYQQQTPRIRKFSNPNQHGTSSNPYQKRHPFEQSKLSRSSPYSTGSSAMPYPRQQAISQYTQAPSNGAPPPYSKNTRSSLPTYVSPTLTEEQKRRMEENRQRALAIRMKRQQG